MTETIFILVPETSRTASGKDQKVQIHRGDATEKSYPVWEKHFDHGYQTTQKVGDTVTKKEAGDTVVIVHGECTIKTLKQVQEQLNETM
jgi:hypothetical protein